MDAIKQGFIGAFLLFWLLVSFQWARFWCETVGHKRRQRVADGNCVATILAGHGSVLMKCPRCGQTETRKIYERKAKEA